MSSLLRSRQPGARSRPSTLVARSETRVTGVRAAAFARLTGAPVISARRRARSAPSSCDPARNANVRADAGEQLEQLPALLVAQVACQLLLALVCDGEGSSEQFTARRVRYSARALRSSGFWRRSSRPRSSSESTNATIRLARLPSVGDRLLRNTLGACDAGQQRERFGSSPSGASSSWKALASAYPVVEIVKPTDCGRPGPGTLMPSIGTNPLGDAPASPEDPPAGAARRGRQGRVSCPFLNDILTN